MSYGLQVINSSNTIQIDDNYRNLFIKSNHIIASVWPGLYDFFDSMAAYEVVAYNLNQGFGYYDPVQLSVFSVKATPSADLYGMRVHKGDGSLVFDSGGRVFSIKTDIIVIRNKYYGYPAVDVYLPDPVTGKTRFILFSFYGGGDTYMSAIFPQFFYPSAYAYDGFTVSTTSSSGIQHIVMSYGDDQNNSAIQVVIIDA